jgi:GH15 family glucan-1,4-alpha-glucosidase
MPRNLPLGNGNLLVTFDNNYQIRDLYWPHVGQENHALGHPFRIGVWVNGQFRMCKSAFPNKGRFSSLLSTIPVHVIVKPDIALFGAACHGFEQLEAS